MIKYHVNEEEQVVTARFEGMENAISNSIRIKFDYFPYKDVLFDIVEIIYKMRKKSMFKNIIGIAYCHPNDNWDVEKGKAIAKARLIHKFNNVYYEVLLTIKKEIEKRYTASMNAINSRIKKHNKNKKKYKDRINKIINKKEEN